MEKEMKVRIKKDKKNGWSGGKWCKHKMSSNSWHLGYPENTIEFEPQIAFLS